MKIIRAEEMGMCFGVRDALKIVDQITRPQSVTVYGELVHNPEVIRRMSDAGFQQSGEVARTPDVETPLVLITAHGISDAEKRRLEAGKKQMIDTTCPLVRRAHEAAMELQNEGRFVLLIGKAGHVEVQGIVGDLTHYDVLADVTDVRTYESKYLGIVSQTTMSTDQVDSIRDAVSRLNPSADIRFIDTVCRPTKLRQQAMLKLINQVDAVVVVGGMNSNNTRRLAALCAAHHKPAYHVESADQLQPEWFEGVENVGLTAGTSTLDETIDEVERTLQSLNVTA